MTPQRTGAVETIDGEANLVLTRMFDSPAEEVWMLFTDPERLSAWIGHWEGDPSTGHVAFFMTAEGEDPPPSDYAIVECDRPRRFAGDTDHGWHLWFELTEADGITTLRFGQRLSPAEDVGSIGPGWEYYLDRAAASRAGQDAAAVAWDDYFPALQAEYAALAP